MTDTVNNSTTYLWYDYETFGTEARKDRPVQYGSFRTDTNFNIIGQSMVLYAQLADDYIPSPGSSLVTGITPMSLMDEENALAEADFAKVIRDEMGKPGTITIGYNNRNYDDEMTRFMFWRNLLPAYDTEYGDGRGRFDVFLLVIAVYAVAPQILKWPTKEDGTVSFKLDRLTPANQLPHRHAHDASSDAFATLQLAKLIASKNPRLWEYALSISKSDKIVELLNEKRPLLYVYVMDKLKPDVSDYLCKHAESVGIDENGKAIPTYPYGEEREAINAKFDELFKTLKEKGLLHEADISQAVTEKAAYTEMQADNIEPEQLSLFDLMKKEAVKKTTYSTAKIIVEKEKSMLSDEENILKMASKIRHNESEDHVFQRQLDKFFGGEMPVHEVINVCGTPNILKILDSQAAKVVINQSDLHNAVAGIGEYNKRHTEGHDIPKEQIYRLSDAIRKPILVLKGSNDNANSVVLLTDLTNASGENVIVPISLDRQNGRINRIATLYGKHNLSNYLELHTADILAVNIKKADMLADLGVQFSQSIRDTVIRFDNSIAYSLDNVNVPMADLINNIQLKDKPITADVRIKEFRKKDGVFQAHILYNGKTDWRTVSRK